MTKVPPRTTERIRKIVALEGRVRARSSEGARTGPATTTPEKPPAGRIALGGKYLDESMTRKAQGPGAKNVAYVSFPAHRHMASVTVEQVTICAHAISVVQLYATGILPPVGGRAIALEVDGHALGEWVLESVECSDRTGVVDDTITLHFRKPTGAAP